MGKKMVKNESEADSDGNGVMPSNSPESTSGDVDISQIKSNVYALTQFGSTALTILSIVHPIFGALGSAANGIIGYFGNKDIIKRVSEIENKLNKWDITIEKLVDMLNGLDEHGRYVFKENLGYICEVAMPETVDALIDSIIAFLLENNARDMNEEICEILRSCNANDMKLLQLIKRHLENNQDGDRESGEGEISIEWGEFARAVGLENEEVSASDIIKGVKVYEGRNQNLDLAYLIRSLKKMQNLGVVEIDYETMLGSISEYNIEKIHVTIFGRNLLERIK